MNIPFSSVLITGGAGFIGSHISDSLVGEGLEVDVLDNFVTGSCERHRKKRWPSGVTVSIERISSSSFVVLLNLAYRVAAIARNDVTETRARSTIVFPWR